MLNIDYIHQSLVNGGAFVSGKDDDGLLAKIDKVRVVSGVSHLSLQFMYCGEVVSVASIESFKVGDELEVIFSGPAFIPVHVRPEEK